MRATIDIQQLSQRESEQVEWKENVADIRDLVATICAFANDLMNLGGGYVICGAREDTDDHGFPRLIRAGLTASRLKEIEGKVLALCRERVDPAITPLVDELPAETPDRRLLVFTVPATRRAHVFRRDQESGCYYVRVGRSTRQARNGVLLQLLTQKGELEPWDLRPCTGATLGDFDLLVLRDAVNRIFDRHRPDPESLLSDTERLHALVPPLCVREPLTGELRPRNFAVLLFGRQPQRFIPGGYSYFSRYPGVDRAADFAERTELLGSLYEQASELRRLVLREATLLIDKTDLRDPNKERYPVRALSEALGNALAHRDYSLPDPTRVTTFANRIEFLSPGGLPLGVTLQQLRRGLVAPRWRNQTLAWIFIKLGFAQGEGQGLTTIRAFMRAAGCPPPQYSATEVNVACVLRAHPLGAA